ncbi:Extracellular solute-binding protein, family 7 [Desulfovibrio sp. X2]|uniref:TRAP transporter substrate-binding protein n=1 Tax=Desulfovibrio sp. X2 TaxID=941449 RepID=UPI000358F061|nr:TRAP transporter substrate-binding protein [Desulfovibrio sp. X2]EPR41099.1 Extracellular solute-binding protein, family 7 [Desulfovibrio sp. X2]
MRTLVAVLAAAVLAAGLAVATPASAARVLSYANFPPASTVPCIQMERWAKELEKRTNGAVSVQTYPGGTLLTAKNMFRGVQTGQADIGCISMSYQPGAFPFSFAMSQPLGFSSAAAASVTLWQMYVKYHPEEFKDVKVVAMFTSAPSNLMAKEPIKTLADLKGMEIRGAGNLSEILAALGAVPVSMPMPDVPEAVQKGVVKGLLTSFEVLKDMNFAEMCRYETVTNLPVYPFAVIMNKRAWASLPKDVQKVIDDLSLEQAEWTGTYWDEHVKEALDWSKQNFGIAVYRLSPEDKATMKKEIAPLVDKWKLEATKAGLPADAILKDIEAAKTANEAKYGGE